MTSTIAVNQVVDDAERHALIALSALCEPGNAELADRIAVDGPARTLAALLAEPDASPLHASVAARARGRDGDGLVAGLLEAAAACGARAVTRYDAEWPGRVDDLAEAFDEADPNTKPPLCLWVRGPHDLAETVETSVSIVGARNCTPYGRTTATQLAYELAQHDWTVVSGGAYGIDAAAHQGTLAANGTTIAVLACGVDRPYPASNANLFDRITHTGLLISEWPPGAIPQRHRFLTRNRVIAALTLGTVVVEAALRSGARHTARKALELDRSLMIVPGPITSAQSAGVHQLARDPGETRIITRAAEIIEDLGRIGADLAPPLRSPDADRDKLDPLAARLLDAIPTRGVAAVEQVAAQAGVTVTEARRRLPVLAMNGLLTIEGDRYRLAR